MNRAAIEVLKRYKKVCVVGLSPNPARPSHGIALYMQRQGYEVVGVHPAAPGGQIAGIKVYPRVADVPGPLEIVNVFRSSDAIGALVDEIIPLRPAVLWLQEGVHDPGAEHRASEAGMEVFFDLCILKVHRFLK